MVRNLFIVSTPLQMLSAVEARERFHQNESCYLAVVRSPLRSGVSAKRFHQTLGNLIDNDWTEIWYPKIEKRQQVLFRLLSSSFIRRIGKVDTIYTATFQTIQSHLINSIPHRSLVLIDDGLGVHSVLKQYRQTARRRSFRHLLLGVQSQIPTTKQFSVFSSFDVDWPNEQTIRNDFRNLRARTAENIPVKSDEVVLITEPTQRAFGITLDYDRLIKNLKSSIGFTSARLIRHPNDQIPPEGSQSLNGPLELFALTEGYLPGQFLGFMSSAMTTLRLIYDCRVSCLELRRTDLKRSRPDPPQDYYPEFKRHGIELIPNDKWNGTDDASRAIVTP